MFNKGQKVFVAGPNIPMEYEKEEATWYTWLPELDVTIHKEATIVDNSKRNIYRIKFDDLQLIEYEHFVYKEEWLKEIEEPASIGLEFPATEDEKKENIDLHVLGAKEDNGKPEVGLLFESFPNALLEVAKVATYGARKYTRSGWRHVENAHDRYLDAAGRHTLKYYIDKPNDMESNMHHLAHQAWNVLAVLELDLVRKISSG